MIILTYISNLIIPIFIFYILGYACLAKQNVYENFLLGAEDGLKVVYRMIPTLVGLMVSVGVLRDSGFLEFLSDFLAKYLKYFGIPAELMPVTLIRFFSSSAATGLLIDIFKKYGTDSFYGIAASLILSSTESIFYCLSIYFGSVKIKKTRYTIMGCIVSATAGIIASLWLAEKMIK